MFGNAQYARLPGERKNILVLAQRFFLCMMSRMREDFPGISTRDRKRYMAIYRAENRERLRQYYRDYRARVKKASAKANGRRKKKRKAA